MWGVHPLPFPGEHLLGGRWGRASLYLFELSQWACSQVNILEDDQLWEATIGNINISLIVQAFSKRYTCGVFYCRCTTRLFTFVCLQSSPMDRLLARRSYASRLLVIVGRSTTSSYLTSLVFPVTDQQRASSSKAVEF